MSKTKESLIPEKNTSETKSAPSPSLQIPTPYHRPRRLRYLANVRRLVRQATITPDDFILPLFIKEGITEKQAIASMPGHYQLTLKDLPAEIDEIHSLKIPAVLLFGIPSKKDSNGTASCDDNGIVQRAIRTIKQHNPEILVITDVCFCEYTDHGHCGVVNPHPSQQNTLDLDNDQTLNLLTAQALSFARAGADLIAPSGMLDGMVAAIRHALDENNFTHLPIMSYAVKYCSALYAPFRDAAEGAPQFGNRATYQQDPANSDEALKEAELDIEEGADMLMVKPANAYLDIIAKVKQAYPSYPLAAYQVSGEYAMVKAAAEKGWIDEKKVMNELLLGIKRAGADIIISYAAKEFCRCL